MKQANLFGVAIKAADNAFGSSRKAFKVSNDPQLDLYGKLDMPDFERIRSQHGDEELIRYVKEMEFKRLRGGRNG